MANNIFQEQITPIKPKVLEGERIYVYVPKATTNTAGIASYNDRDFGVNNGRVSLIWPEEMLVEELSNPLIQVSSIKVLSDEFVNTNNIASLTNPITGVTYNSNTAEVMLNRKNRNAFVRPDFVMLDNTKDFESSTDENGFVKYTLKRNNPLEQPSLIQVSANDFVRENGIVKINWTNVQTQIDTLDTKINKVINTEIQIVDANGNFVAGNGTIGNATSNSIVIGPSAKAALGGSVALLGEAWDFVPVAIGSGSEAGDHGVAIGANAQARQFKSVALGAMAEVYASQAAQIGQGENNEYGTLKFRNYTIINKDGKVFTNVGDATSITMKLVATEEYVNALFGSLKSVTLQIVDTLPTVGESNIIYMVPIDDGSGQNFYEEYIYIENEWELIGTTKVDLSNYYTKTEVDGLMLTSYKQIILGADGVAEDNVYNFTVESPDTYSNYKTNGTKFLVDLNLPIVGALDASKRVVITFGDTVYYIYNILKGTEPVTIGDLAQVDKYSNATGYRFIAEMTFFENADITGFAIIPTISMSDVLSLTSDEMDAYMAEGGLTDGQLAVCKKVITNGYSEGAIYRFDITYPDTYSWTLLSGSIKLADFEELQSTVNELTPKVMRALVTPLSAPTSIELVAVDDGNAQTMIEIGEGLVIRDGVLIATAGSGTGGGVSYEEFDNLVNNVTQIVSANNSIKLGNAQDTPSAEAVAIGYNASARSIYSVAIGSGANCISNYNVSIGHRSSANYKALALGDGANANANHAIQLSTGTNINEKTLQVWDDNIYNGTTHTLTVQNAQVNGSNVYGVLFGTEAPTTTTVGSAGQIYIDTVAQKIYQCISVTEETVEDVTSTVYTWVGMVNQSEFDKLVNNETQINSNAQKSLVIGGAFLNKSNPSITLNSVSIGNNATSLTSNSIVIGVDGYTQGANDIVIGKGSRAEANAGYNIIIGTGGKITWNNGKCIQLGTGTNSVNNTLQIFNDNIYNHSTHTLTVQNIELNGADLQGTLSSLEGQNEYIGRYEGSSYTADTIQTELSAYVLTTEGRAVRAGDIVNIVNGVYAGQQWIYSGETLTWKYYIDFENHSVINNLTSTSTTDGLSAMQGKVLNDMLNSLTQELVDTQNDVADNMADISTLQGKVSTLESDNTTNKTNISTLQSNLVNYLPLSGGTMTGPIIISGGDAATGRGNIQLDVDGQIVAKGTSRTLFGRADDINLYLGHSSYNLLIRGSATRPTYNGSNMALQSDIPTFTVNGTTLTITL